MTVPFQQIPTSLRIPLFFAEVDASKANLGSGNQPSLIVGQMTSAGTATANVPVLVQGVAWAKGAFGVGSMLALMVEQYRARDPFGTLYALPLADNGAGTAATGSVNFTAAATANGTYTLYVAGSAVSIPVLTTQTAANLATALAAAINANTDLPVTAAVDGSTTSKVNITAKHKGADAGDITLIENFMSKLTGDTSEALPAGLTTAITAMSGGATNPTVTTALANLGDHRFDFIAWPFNDSTSLNALQASLTARWGYLSMLYGGAFGAYRGTVGSRTTFGLTRNDPGISIMGFYGAPEPTWIWAADYAAAMAESLRADPALPMNDAVKLNVLPPLATDRDAAVDRNTLLFDGISTFTVNPANEVQINRSITTYQYNAQSQPSDAWLDVQRRYTTMYALRDLRNFIETRYARFKIADDGQIIPPGANITTAKRIRADVIGRYRFLERAGYVQDTAGFKANLVVERNSGNRNRVDVLWPVVPIDPLIQVAVLAQLHNASSLGG